MPTTSDGKKFPYTADGIRAAEAHERFLQQNRRTMGEATTSGDPFATMPNIKKKPRPGPRSPDESYMGYRGGGAAPKVPPRQNASTDIGFVDKFKKSIGKIVGKEDGVNYAIGPGGKEISSKEAIKIFRMKRVYDAKKDRLK